MKWAIDLDQTITSNPDFFRFLIQLLSTNGVEVHILTARNTLKRSEETEGEFRMLGLCYLKNNPIILHTMPKHDPDWKKQAEWKISKVKEIKPDIWIDNDFKMWERIFKIDLDKELSGITRLQI